VRFLDFGSFLRTPYPAFSSGKKNWDNILSQFRPGGVQAKSVRRRLGQKRLKSRDLIISLNIQNTK